MISLFLQCCSFEFCAGVVALLMCIYLWMKPIYCLPPRPNVWNYFFNVPRGKPLHKWLAKTAEEVGPVFRVRLGLRDAVVINSLDYVKLALTNCGDDFAGRGRRKVMEIIMDNLQDPGGNPHCPLQIDSKKIMKSTLHEVTNTEKFERSLHEKFVEYQAILDGKAVAGVPFDPKVNCDVLVFNCLMSLCFNKTYREGDKDLVEMVKAVDCFVDGMSSLTLSDHVPLLSRLPIDMPDVRRYRKVFSQLRESIAREINIQKDCYASEYPQTLVHHFMNTMKRQAVDDTGMNDFTDRHLKLLLVDLVIGNGMFMRTSLLWILNLLAIHQDSQQKIYDEILNVCESTKDRRISYKDYRSKMPYSEAFLLETFRYTSIFPLGFPRRSIRHCQLGPYDIPVDTTILVNFWAINHDIAYHNKPDVFSPERFLSRHVACADNVAKGCWPFGLGMRACPVEDYARACLWSLMTMICRRYVVLPPNGKNLPANWNNNSFISGPEPFEITLTLRRH